MALQHRPIADTKTHPVLLAGVNTLAENFHGELTIQNAPISDLKLASLETDKLFPIASQQNTAQNTKQVTVKDLPVGYYEFKATDPACPNFQQYLFIHPKSCFCPAQSTPKDILMVQLYALSSDRNWGIGDFTDLKLLLKQCAGKYAYVGVNPLHALSPNDLTEISPYAPDSRLLYNELYLDIEKVAADIGADLYVQKYKSRAFQQELQKDRAHIYIDYQKTGTRKLRELQNLFRFFIGDLHRRDQTTKQFSDFIQASTTKLHAVLYSRTLSRKWFKRSISVYCVLFEYFLQWHCERQIQSALTESSCRLYFDLAIGIAQTSSEISANKGLFSLEKSLGAAPDEFSTHGQIWNIAPLNCLVSQRTGHMFFRSMIAANMKYASALRVDNIASYFHRFTIPTGMTAKHGTYENIPFREFFAILAIESHRHHCIVIGEDLGVIPKNLRPELRRWKIFGSLVYQHEFQKINADEIPPSRSQSSLFSFSTHDCPPLIAFKNATDIDIHRALGRICANEAKQKRKERAVSLSSMFCQQTPDFASTAAREQMLRQISNKVAAPINGYLLDDILGEVLPVNVPGTDKEYPNWQRKYSTKLSSGLFL